MWKLLLETALWLLPVFAYLKKVRLEKSIKKDIRNVLQWKLTGDFC